MAVRDSEAYCCVSKKKRGEEENVTRPRAARHFAQAQREAPIRAETLKHPCSLLYRRASVASIQCNFKNRIEKRNNRWIEMKNIIQTCRVCVNNLMLSSKKRFPKPAVCRNFVARSCRASCLEDAQITAASFHVEVLKNLRHVESP